MNINFETACCLFDQSSDLVQVIAPDGMLLYANSTWKRVLGYDTAPVPTGQAGDQAPGCFWQVLRPEDRDRFQHICSQLRADGDSCTLSLTLLSRNGETVAVTGRVCLKQDKTPQFWCLWCRSPEPVEQTLRQVEERYSLATRAARVGVWEWQVQTGEFYLDPNVKAILGYTDAEIPNDLHLWVNYVHPDDRQPVMEAAQAHLEGHTPEYVFEHRMLHKNGTIRWILVRGLAIRDVTGAVVRMVGTDTDITDRKQAEILLDLQNRTLASIAAGESLAETWQELMAAIEAQLEGAISSIVLLDAGRKLRPACAPRLPAVFNQAVDGLAIGEGVGSCGTAAFRREPVMVADIASDPLWQNYKMLALEHGLRACWSVPVIARNNQVMGTFAVYFQTVRSPRLEDLEILFHAANIARLALERHQAETILRQKAEQAHLIAYLTRQIRQSLDLRVILRTAVTEVRQLLETDRVTVYRFNPDNSGQIIVESVLEPWVAILDHTLQDPCFAGERVEQYRRGRISRIEDIQTAGLEPCYVAFLEQFQVRANLAVPIVQEGQLWGLLCVHHCRAPRFWQDSEVELLTQLSNQLAIAIHQATTYQYLQEELQVRQQTEARLRDSEAQNRAILSAIPDILTSIRADGTYLHFSQNAFTGTVLPVRPGTRVTDVLPWDVATRKLEAIQAALRTGEMQLYEQELQWGDRIQHEEVRMVPYREDAVLCMVRDISDRKRLEKEWQQVEAALRRSEAQYRAIVEDQTELIYRFLPNGIITFVNQAYCRYFGQTPTDLLGQSFLPLIPPEDQPLVQQAAAQITLECPIVTYEHRVFLPDGTLRWQQWTDRGIFDAQGQLIEYQAVGRDITEHKQAEQQIQQLNQDLEAKVEQRTAELRDSEERFRSLYEQSPLGISITDLQGRFLQVNDQLCRITGHAASDLMGQDFHHIIHPDDQSECIQQFYQVVAGEQSRSVIEKRYIAPTGDLVWVQTTRALLCDRQGQPVGVISMVQDISDRKATEEALRHQEELLNLFFAQSLDGFFFMMLDQPVVWDDTTDKEAVITYAFAHHRITRVNDAIVGQYGATTEQFLGLTPADLFAHDLDYGKTVWRQFFDAGRLHVETRERKLDGTPIFIEGDYICLYDSEGRITGHFGVQRDVSDRKAAESALSESEARFRRLTENLPGMVYRYVTYADGSDAFTYVSPRSQELYDISPEEMLKSSANVWKLIHPDDVPILQQSIQDCIAFGLPRWSQEHRVVTASGDCRWLQAASHPTQQPNGDVIWEGFAVDISDRKRLEAERREAEQALRDSETRFRTLVQNVNVGIVVQDAQEQVLLHNPRALELLGLTEAQLFGKAPPDPRWGIIHENGSPLPSWESPVAQAIATRQSVRNRVVGIRRPNTGLPSDRYPGHVVWLLVNADPQLTPEEEVNQVIVSFADITYLKQLESKAFKALQKERELKEMKSRFASMISHEFRTPLTVIQSAADVLQLLTEDLDECQEYYRQIAIATQHMMRMLNDILWIGKFDSGQMESHWNEIDLVAFCQEMLREFELAYGKIYRFQFNVMGTPQRTLLDPKLLRPMLNNLLSNAVKYSPSHSTVELRLLYDPKQVILKVQDYGIGIPEQDQKQLFEAFYRAGNVETIQGTGLGLAIVKNCVDLHGGQIELESQLGLGTTFTIRLPYRQRAIASCTATLSPELWTADLESYSDSQSPETQFLV